jgi:amino-acid N-acetyltransferase
VTVRPARPGDLAPLEEFIAPFVADHKLLPRTTDELSDLLPTGFVAECERRIVGFATLEIYSRKLGELRSLCVAPELQGRGIGKRLVAACLDLARQRRVFEVMVITSEEEFFQRCGFDFTLPGEKKALFLQTRNEP